MVSELISVYPSNVWYAYHTMHYRCPQHVRCVEDLNSTRHMAKL